MRQSRQSVKKAPNRQNEKKMIWGNALFYHKQVT